MPRDQEQKQPMWLHLAEIFVRGVKLPTEQSIGLFG